MRDLRQVNLALLAKWRWRFLLGDGGLWREIITARYGVCHPSPHLGGRQSDLRGVSFWWSSISLLGGEKDASGDWFSEGVVRVIGDGLSTQFWHDPWCGPAILRVRFRRLYHLSLQMVGKVGELGHWEDGAWVWDLLWRKPLFIWESELLVDLLAVAVRPLRVNREDRWSWSISTDGLYSVKSAYSILIKDLPATGTPVGEELRAVSRVWKSWAPSKVIFFRGSFSLIGSL